MVYEVLHLKLFALLSLVDTANGKVDEGTGGNE
jgi:hypothetical protein